MKHVRDSPNNEINQMIDAAVMKAINKVCVDSEESYSKGTITRERADERIRVARLVGQFLMGGKRGEKKVY